MTIHIDCSTPEKLDRFAEAIGKAAAGGQLVDIKAVAEKAGGRRRGTVEVEAYSQILTADQSKNLYDAFDLAIRYAKKSGLMSEEQTRRLENVFEMFGSLTPCPSFKTPEEKTNDWLESMYADCAKYGCD